MDNVHYIWLLLSVEAILPDKLSLSYEQRLLAHAHYARCSTPAFLDEVLYLWLLSSVEAILPDKRSLSYEQRMLAHAHYARSSPPAFPALHFKPFRFANMSAAFGRQRCFARCVSVDRCFASCVAVDFLRLQSSTFKCWDVWGLDRWCRLVGATPLCSTGIVLFRRQGVGGFGTDPQMPAVPSIGPSVCFHLKGSRLKWQMPSSPWLASIPSPLSVLAAC